jgi:hypothetical protein
MSEFVEVRVSDLSGPALDWAVGKALDWVEPIFGVGQISYIAEDNFLMMAEPDPDEPDEISLIQHFNHYTQWSPSRLWSQCGRIIENNAIGFVGEDADNWLAFASPCDVTHQGVGGTHLIAACRLVVSAELGETVSVPKELLPC